MQYVSFVIQQVYFKTGLCWITKTYKETLHCVESFNCDDYVRQAMTEMGDTKLLAKLSEGDMIAREACYHEHCMTNFRNKFRKFSNDQENHVKGIQRSLEAIAFAKCMSLKILCKVVMKLHLSQNCQLYKNFIVIALKT